VRKPAGVAHRLPRRALGHHCSDVKLRSRWPLFLRWPTLSTRRCLDPGWLVPDAPPVARAGLRSGRNLDSPGRPRRDNRFAMRKGGVSGAPRETLAARPKQQQRSRICRAVFCPPNEASSSSARLRWRRTRSRAARPRREARFEAVPCVRRGGLGYFAVVLSRVGRGDSRRMTRPSSSRRGSCGGETRRGAVASGRLIAADAQSSCVAVWLGFGAWSCSGALPRGKVSSCSSR
jgi:hypothetical protein